MSISSRVRLSGLLNPTPCQPSITWGPLVPIPRRNRPFEAPCIAIEVMPTSDGVRVPIWKIPVPSLIVEVCGARKASGVSASCAHASADHAWSTPSFSASIA
jgi:hypothetical protein